MVKITTFFANWAVAVWASPALVADTAIGFLDEWVGWILAVSIEATGRLDALVTTGTGPAGEAAAHVWSKALSMLATISLTAWLIAQRPGPALVTIQALEGFFAASMQAARQGDAHVAPVSAPAHRARAHLRPLAHPVLTASPRAQWGLAQVVDVRPPVAANHFTQTVAGVTPLVELKDFRLTG